MHSVLFPPITLGYNDEGFDTDSVMYCVSAVNSLLVHIWFWILHKF